MARSEKLIKLASKISRGAVGLVGFSFRISLKLGSLIRPTSTERNRLLYSVSTLDFYPRIKALSAVIL